MNKFITKTVIMCICAVSFFAHNNCAGQDGSRVSIDGANDDPTKPAGSPITLTRLVQPFVAKQTVNYIGTPALSARNWRVGEKVEIGIEQFTIESIKISGSGTKVTGTLASFDIITLVEKPKFDYPAFYPVVYLGHGYKASVLEIRDILSLYAERKSISNYDPSLNSHFGPEQRVNDIVLSGSESQVLDWCRGEKVEIGGWQFRQQFTIDGAFISLPGSGGGIEKIHVVLIEKPAGRFAAGTPVKYLRPGRSANSDAGGPASAPGNREIRPFTQNLTEKRLLANVFLLQQFGPEQLFNSIVIPFFIFKAGYMPDVRGYSGGKLQIGNQQFTVGAARQGVEVINIGSKRFISVSRLFLLEKPTESYPAGTPVMYLGHDAAPGRNANPDAGSPASVPENRDIRPLTRNNVVIDNRSGELAKTVEQPVSKTNLVQQFGPEQTVNYIGIPALYARNWRVGAKLQIVNQQFTIESIRISGSGTKAEGTLASFDIVVLAEKPAVNYPAGTHVMYLGDGAPGRNANPDAGIPASVPEKPKKTEELFIIGNNDSSIPASVPEKPKKPEELFITEKPYTKNDKKWPAMSGELNGAMEVRIKNPNNFEVKVGLRSGGKGKDFVVLANSIKSVKVPNGQYDIFFRYSTDSDKLFQGDSFKINNNGIEIQIVKVVNGNYKIRQVK